MIKISREARRWCHKYRPSHLILGDTQHSSQLCILSLYHETKLKCQVHLPVASQVNSIQESSSHNRKERVKGE